MSYRCEECGEVYAQPPTSVATYPGVEDDVELWFCEECTRHER